MATQKKNNRKLSITKRVDVDMPDAPKVKDGELAMRMVYNDGQVRDIIASSMPEVIDKAMAQAEADGKHFKHPDHIVSWERVA